MDEEAPLIESGRSQVSQQGKGKFKAATRFISYFVLLVCFGGASYHFNSNLRDMAVRLQAEQGEIEKITKNISNITATMSRFDTTITNSDVLVEMAKIEQSMKDTEARMEQKVKDTQASISNTLSKTLLELDQTVSKAQTTIQAEVDTVHSDVQSYVQHTQDQFSAENNFMMYQLAGTFTLIGCLISMWHMTDHFRHFNQPFIQRKVLAILWMCPIYSITSWLSLVFPAIEGYLGIIKDFYEAYAIYSFLSFLIAVIGKGDFNVVVDSLALHSDHLKPPWNFFGLCYPKEYEDKKLMAHDVLVQCIGFALQFVVFKPLISILLFTCNKFHYYGLGTSSSDWRSIQSSLNIVQNVSIFVAFAGLLKFYHAVEDEISWCRPFAKFLCIKGVVFMTFWQGLVIAILASYTQQMEGGEGNGSEYSARIQNFLICLEMLLFSIAHFYVFPVIEWEEGYRPKVNKDAKFGDNIALRDFIQDLKLVLGNSERKQLGKAIPEFSKSLMGEDEPLDNDSNDDDSILSIQSIEQKIKDARMSPASPLVRYASERILKSGVLEVLNKGNPKESMDEESPGLQGYGSTIGVTTNIVGNSASEGRRDVDQESANENTVLGPSFSTVVISEHSEV